MTASGYIVLGPDPANPAKLRDDWDGEVHVTEEEGWDALDECHRAGYTDYALYRVQLYGVLRLRDPA